MPLSGPGLRSPRLWGATGIVVVLAVFAAVVLWQDSPPAARAAAAGPPHTTVQVSRGACGTGWADARPGLQVFDLHNSSDVAAEVYLEDAASKAVYGEVEDIGPGTTRSLTVDIGKGAYAFQCVPDDGDAITGPTVRITSGQGGPAAAPVSRQDLVPPSIAYQKWVAGGLDRVVRLTGDLRDAVDRGDLAAARKAWLPAHLEYERLGAAYDAFGDADGQINGTDAGLPGGVADPSFTGFHRIEYGLWHGRSAGSLRAPAADLVAAVTALRDSWSQARMDPAQLGLRAHEILENTVQFELTGRTDYGSGSNLATARANLDGTREVLSRLRPLLATRYQELPQLDHELDAAQDTLDGLAPDGEWIPLARLTRAQREKVDAALDELVERLASVATLCEPRRTV
ncbi:MULTISPECIES: EfeM/EfeO family lipoprotein [unclassified Streptomyces]|uniref:EfeM/EfeO family lipoprotein n=1 Tax=unclassified Streptomyces TaxID=2593676 RepID=UPI0038276506